MRKIEEDVEPFSGLMLRFPVAIPIDRASQSRAAMLKVMRHEP